MPQAGKSTRLLVHFYATLRLFFLLCGLRGCSSSSRPCPPQPEKLEHHCPRNGTVVKHYQLPDEPKPLSGEGHLFEYYHFLIDFAAEVLYLLDHADANDDICRTRRKVLILRPTLKLVLALPSDRKRRSMVTHAAYLFAPAMIRIQHASFKLKESHASTLAFSPHSYPWSQACAQIYRQFREYAWHLADDAGARPHMSSSDVHDTADVIIIRRKSYRNARTCFGACKRDLPESFFVAAQNYFETDEQWGGSGRKRWYRDLDGHGLALNSSRQFAGGGGRKAPVSPLSVKVVELEGMTLKEQILLFRDSTVAIGIHGAGLSNVVFQRPGAALIELGDVEKPCFEPLATKLDVRYWHVGPLGAHFNGATELRSVLAEVAKVTLMPPWSWS